MFPNPDLSHLNSKDYDSVYEPSEDTFLLMDALEEAVNDLRTMQPLICMEIGSGTGCVTAFLAQLLKGHSRPLFICTDRNERACRVSRETAKRNSVDCCECIQTDLVAGLTSRHLQNSVDILIFNPPYVVTPSEEIYSNDPLAWAWAGGKDGREVIDRFLHYPNMLLSRKGRFYMVSIQSNRPEELMEYMESKYQLKGSVVKSRKVGIEHLKILCFERK